MVEGGDQVQDEVPGWGEETVPPQQDAIPFQLRADRTLARRPPRWRGALATAFAVVALAAAVVAPIGLCIRAWHEAESIRGVGAGRGLFTVSACGDRQEDSEGGVTYTCTGRFDGRWASGLRASVTSSTRYHTGARTAARVVGARDVQLASPAEAAAMMALWLIVACALGYVEVVAVVALQGWIRGSSDPLLVEDLIVFLGMGVVGAFPAWVCLCIPLLILYHLW